VLNLLSTWVRHKDKPEYAAQPFFQNTRLNRAMFLKHRLRQDEMDLFDQPRLTATKIVFPVDPKISNWADASLSSGRRIFPICSKM
jgi:hypothetical protein